MTMSMMMFDNRYVHDGCDDDDDTDDEDDVNSDGNDV